MRMRNFSRVYYLHIILTAFFLPLPLPFSLFLRLDSIMVKRKRARQLYGTSITGRRFKYTRAPAKRRRITRKRVTRTAARGIYRGGIVRNGRIVTMRFVFHIQLANEILSDKYQFRANGLFDPDYTSTGGQPRGFDEFMSLYNTYGVISSKLTINVNNPLNFYNTAVGIRVDDNPALFNTSLKDIFEEKGGAKRLTPGDKRNMRMTYSVNPRKYFSRSGTMENNPDLLGNSGADPTKVLYYTITTINPRAADDSPLQITGWIDYKVQLIDPKKIGVS